MIKYLDYCYLTCVNGIKWDVFKNNWINLLLFSLIIWYNKGEEVVTHGLSLSGRK